MDARKLSRMDYCGPQTGDGAAETFVVGAMQRVADAAERLAADHGLVAKLLAATAEVERLKATVAELNRQNMDLARQRDWAQGKQVRPEKQQTA